MPIANTLDEPLTEVIALDNIPPVQDSAIDNLTFFFFKIDTKFLFKFLGSEPTIIEIHIKIRSLNVIKKFTN